MLRSNCIFCDNKLDDSDEHIIPVSINGRLHSRQLICSNCNSKVFGLKIDPEIKRLLNPLLLMIGFKNANSLQAVGIESDRYVVNKNHEIIPIRPNIKVYKKDGKIAVNMVGDKKNTMSLLKKTTEKLEKKGFRQAETKIIEEKSRLPILSLAFKIELTSALVVFLNKIAIEYYAYNKGVMNFLGDLPSRVINMREQLGNVMLCNFGNEIRDFENEEVSHLIYVEGNKEQKTIYAYIELMNVICAIVTLSRNYTGNDYKQIYYQDMLTGKSLTREVILKKSLHQIFDLAAANDNFENLTNYLAERIRSREFHHVLSHNLKLIMDDLNKYSEKNEITEKERAEIYLKSSTDLIAWLAIFHFPYVIEDEQFETDEFNFIQSNFREEKVEQFIEQSKHWIGKKIISNDEEYTVDSFYQQLITFRRNLKLTKIFFVLKSITSERKKYVPVSDFFKAIAPSSDK